MARVSTTGRKDETAPGSLARAESAPIDLVSTETVYRGFGTLSRHRFARRAVPGVFEREVLDRGDGAAVLPVDLRAAEVVLVRQFRPAPWLRGDGAELIECVAGLVGDGEDAQATVRREAAEEAGCRLGRLAAIAHCFTCPAALTERVAIFLGELLGEERRPVYGVAAEGERTAPCRVAIERLPAMIASGAIADAKTLIAVQALLLDYPGLKGRWAVKTSPP